MWKDLLRAASASAVLIGGTSAMAADLDYPPDAAYENNGGSGYEGDYRRPVRHRGSVTHAYRKLEKHGFYNIVVERTDLPYSFRACKRDKRYHIHMDENGELEELNPLGACQQYADEYDGGPRYSGGGDEQWRRSVYRRARHYY